MKFLILIALVGFAASEMTMDDMSPAHMDWFMGRLMNVLGQMKSMQMMMAAKEGRGQLCPHVMGKMCVGEKTEMGMKFEMAMKSCMGGMDSMNATMRLDDMMEEGCLEEFKAKMHMKHCVLTKMGWLKDCMPMREQIQKDMSGTLIGMCPHVMAADMKCGAVFEHLTCDCIKKMEGGMDSGCPETDAMLLKAAQNIGYFMCMKEVFTDSCMFKGNLVLFNTMWDDMGMPTGVDVEGMMKMIMDMHDKM